MGIRGRLYRRAGLGGRGPFFDYSETWQLYINTGTTIAAFLMVFLIQNTLDDLIRVTHPDCRT